jgi:hypothetical protein
MTDLFIGGRLDEAGEITDLHRIEPERLRRHGVVIGMTGSGKTGLSIVLLEELILAGVPVIALDPKGDLANLALVFPQLSGAEFAPWVDPDQARREGTTPQELGETIAARWAEGLREWGITPDRVAELRDRTALTIYTPGSDAGVPVNVVAALRRPDADEPADAEIRRGLVSGTVSAMLGLVGVQADPIRDPEHLVMSRIIDEAWSAGEDLDGETLILRIVDPPFKKVGVFPVDSFWKPDRRLDLAMRLNGVLSSPAFAAWTRGVPLDLPALTTGPPGRTPVSVFYMAHLDDSERMFFASLLLERIVAWSRSLPGTGGLRALIYLDEAYGYLPPHPANPPTKKPLLTLMKQARAVGVGVLLATQNPVDLDYKALTNAGSWFIGRLSTQQDVERVAQGLQAAAGGADISDTIGALRPRQFVHRDVTEDAPSTFAVRWAMSFLRGPVSRRELKDLPSHRGTSLPPEPEPAPSKGMEPADDTTAQAPPTPGRHGRWFLDPRAVLAARMDGAFEAFATARRDDGAVEFRPALYARVELRFDEERVGYVLEETQHRVFFPLDGSGLPDEPIPAPILDADLLGDPPAGARFAALPEFLDEKRELTAARKRLKDDVWRSESRGQWVCAPLKLHGRADEPRDRFERRCRDAAEDAADVELVRLSRKFERKIARLRDKIRKKEARVAQYESKVTASRAQEALNGVELLASMFFGRRRSLSSVASRRRASAAAAHRLEAVADDVVALEVELSELRSDLEARRDEIEVEALSALDEIEEREVRLEKNDISVRDFGILWIPVSRRL